MIGRTIGKYRVVGHIGRGGAGVVYRAIDETLQREVAIKTLNPDLANTEVMKRFRAEATILARLNHPHIATIYELYRSDTDLLMVMELVRGETLESLSQRLGPLSPDSAAYLLDRILSGLEHAHRDGIVHRDMKPANVMVTEGGGVKIMDFGIARVRGVEQMTIDGRLMGTPAYMPPEQVLGQEVDGRADLYSAGVVLYRLLTAALPFQAETPFVMMQRQILEKPTPLDAHRPGLPAWCASIVDRALAKAPEDRFQTAEEFREELRRAAGALTTTDFAQAVVIAAPAHDTLDLSRVEMNAPMSTAAAGATRQPRTAFVWAAALLAVVALGGLALGYAALQRQSQEAAVAGAPPGDPEAAVEPARAPDAVPTTAAPELPVDARRIAAADGSEDLPAARPAPVEPARRPARTPARVVEPLLVFDTKTIVGTKKPREHDARLVLTNGLIKVTPDIESEYPFYSIPYSSVISITYSRGRDPMWNSPEGPLPLTRSGGALSRIGISVARDWIALRTTTVDQFVAMRFEDVLVRRVLLALEERTGRRPDLMAAPKDGR